MSLHSNATYLPKVLTTPFRSQVVELSFFFSVLFRSEEEERLHSLYPVWALRIYIKRTQICVSATTYMCVLAQQLVDMLCPSKVFRIGLFMQSVWNISLMVSYLRLSCAAIVHKMYLLHSCSFREPPCKRYVISQSGRF